MNRKQKEAIEGSYNRALELWREGNFEAALQILSEIGEAHPRFPVVYGIMGAIFREMGDLENAIKYFQRTVELSPKSEVASLGLSQSLRDVGRKYEAVEEMKRFLAVADSDEYRLQLQEMNDCLRDNPSQFAELTYKSSRN